MHKFAPLAAVVAALALAGCGGGDDESNQALSYDAFGAAAGEVCQDVSGTIDPLQSQFTGDVKKDAAIFDDLIPALQSGTDDLAALEPPEELQSTFDDYLAKIEEQEAGAIDAQKAAEAGDQEEYIRILETVDQISTESDLDASKLGATGCID